MLFIFVFESTDGRAQSIQELETMLLLFISLTRTQAVIVEIDVYILFDLKLFSHRMQTYLRKFVMEEWLAVSSS